MSKWIKPVLFLVITVVLLEGCSWNKSKPKVEPKEASALELYTEAKQALHKGDYMGAIEQFEALETRYPFGRHAQQAQLEMAFAYYKLEEPESTLATLERFIRTYPRHPNIDYAYYLRALANFNRGISFFDRYLPLDLSRRDPQSMLSSFQDFKDLIKRFPDSRYVADAKQRMVYLRNQLARHELHVADYYMRRKAYLAAVKRAQYVLEHYNGTPAVEDALVIMVKGYELMDMPELRNDAVRVLSANYPDNPEIK